jgi:hypothetical protein
MQRWALLAGLTLLTAGCGRDAASLHRQYKVSGVVRLNGDPLRAGTINFVSVEQKGSSSYPLRDGTFEMKAASGPVRVEVTGPGVPPLYGGKDSPLRAEVARNDDNHFEFDVPAAK